MITMTMDLFGLEEVTRSLFLVSQEMEAKIPAAINQVCQTGAEMVSGYALVESGDLRASVDFSPAVETGDGWEGRIGTGSPYGRRRMDLGFDGVDSLGRNYSDPPHPAFGLVAPQLPGMLARALRG